MAYRPTRVAEFSYIGQHRYFLTICVDHRARVFENQAVAAEVIDQLLQCAQAHDFEVLAYCVMPDHVHVLMVGLVDTANLPRVVKAWKQKTGLWWKQGGHGTSLWQEGFYDRILREDDVTEGVIRYILLNPVRAGLASDPRDYPYLGAMKYDVQTLLESSCFWTPPWK